MDITQMERQQFAESKHRKLISAISHGIELYENGPGRDSYVGTFKLAIMIKGVVADYIDIKFNEWLKQYPVALKDHEALSVLWDDLVD